MTAHWPRGDSENPRGCSAIPALPRRRLALSEPSAHRTLSVGANGPDNVVAFGSPPLSWGVLLASLQRVLPTVLRLRPAPAPSALVPRRPSYLSIPSSASPLLLRPNFFNPSSPSLPRPSLERRLSSRCWLASGAPSPPARVPPTFRATACPTKPFFLQHPYRAYCSSSPSSVPFSCAPDHPQIVWAFSLP